jgi:hypothetical protein
MTGVSDLKKAEQRLKPCEECTFCSDSYDEFFFGGGGSQGVLFLTF